MSLGLLILSDIRFVREGLADVLGRDSAFEIVGVAADFAEARDIVNGSSPRLVLIDTAFPDGLAVVAELHKCSREAQIVAFALAETEAEVIAWAAAGISGYIPRNTALSALVGALKDIERGEQICPTRIASSMLRWIAQHAATVRLKGSTVPQTILTPREDEVASLIGAGLSNKEIARRLNISLATTKSHVHNVLAKLGVGRRIQAADHLRTDRRPPLPFSTR